MQEETALFTPPPVDCEGLFSILRGYEQYRLLTAAFDLGVFAALRQPTKARDLGAQLSTDPALTERMLNCLAAIGLVRKEREAYVNSGLAATYLDPESPFAIPNLIALIRKSEPLWNTVGERLKGTMTGSGGRVEGVFDASFTLAMAEGALRGGLQRTLQVMADRSEFQRARSLLDLGGGHGLYAIAFAKANRRLQITFFDLPPVVEVARQFVSRFQAGDRVTLRKGNFLTDEIGSGYDIVFASDALYRPPDQLEPLLGKIRAALNPGGAFITKHWAMAPDRTGPRTTVLWEFRLALTGHGLRVYDNDEYAALLERCGFGPVEVVDISSEAKPSSLVFATKRH